MNKKSLLGRENIAIMAIAAWETAQLAMFC
jgi:hypothetical protein